MIQEKRVLAIIPARGGSKGLPGKNSRLLQGIPLLAWPIKAALQSQYIDQVLVSTDDEDIAQIARDYGANVPFIRPKHLAQDDSPTSDAVIHALDYLAVQNQIYDYIVLLEPTSPLTNAREIDEALERILASGHHAIVGVSRVESSHPMYCASIGINGCLKPFNQEYFSKPLRRQDLEPLYCFDGSLYISEVQQYRQYLSFYHDSTLPYEMPSWKSIEIDTLLDFIKVEAILNHQELLHEL